MWTALDGIVEEAGVGATRKGGGTAGAATPGGPSSHEPLLGLALALLAVPPSIYFYARL